MKVRFLTGFIGRIPGLWFAGKASALLIALMLWGLYSVAQTPPVISVRFNNPSYDCQAQTYCVDVEFNSNTANLRLYDMNVRFFYETSVLEYLSTGGFAAWYTDRKAPMPYISTESGTNFGITGNVNYWNGSVFLFNAYATDITPISSVPGVWTKLFSLCFKVLNPAALGEAGICPSLIWDLEADPLLGGFGDQSDGVVITYLAPETVSPYLSATENVVQYNWAYDADPATLPYGSKSSTICLPGDAVPPVITTTAVSQELGCNPTVTAPEFSATDNCDPLVTPVVTTDGPTNVGCTYSQTWTANCKDAFGNPALPVSITYTWTQDTQLPVITTVDTDKDLGCNPGLIALPVFTGSDNCVGVFEPVVTTSGPVRNGCAVSQSWLANYTDACGNKAATVSVTYTWKEDLTKPQLAGLPQGGELGCNPQTLPDCDPGVTASDNCDGAIPVNCGPGAVVVTGTCGRTQTFVYSATDACGNAVSASVTYTWTVATEPVFANLPAGGDLGCNPTVLPACSPTVTASNECGAVTVNCTPGAIVNMVPCGRSRTFTYTATACGLTATRDVTYTWTEDTTPPTLTGCPAAAVELGINPAAEPQCADALALVTAIDACSGVLTPACQAAAVITNGCRRTQSFTLTATDGCQNSASCVVTFTWTVDTGTPEFVDCPALPIDLGCNPVLPDCLDALAEVTVVDGCSGTLLPVCTPGVITENGCQRNQVFTLVATNNAGKSATCTVTFTWTHDVTPPVLSGCPAAVIDLGLNPASLPDCATALNLITATDACSGPLTPTCQAAAVISDGCKRTQSFTLTATDGCRNSASCVVTYTWITGVPEFVNCPPAPVALGCNPVLPDCEDALALVTATDGCGAPLIPACTPGAITENGCGRSQLFTLVATSNTGLSATCTVTFTWTQDTTLPVITTTAQNRDLGCSPEVVAPVFTGTDNCQGTVTPVVTTAGPVQSGCAWSQTWTANYTDGCGNAALPVSITYTWTVDTGLPVITTTAVSGDLGCNPVIVPPVFTATDNCQGTVTPTVEAMAVGGSDCYYRATYTATYTDGCGNQAVPVSITWTWKLDPVPPVFTAPADVTIAGDQDCNYNANPDITGRPEGVSDDCTITPTVGYTDVIAAGTTPGTRVLTRTWTATDGCNNKTVKVQHITITGGSPPVLNLHDHCVYLNEYGKWTLNSWDQYLMTQGSTGGCGIGKLSFSFDPNSFNCAMAPRKISVKVTATDGAGNTVTGTVWVTVADTLAPVAICKDVTVTLDASGQAYVTQNQVNNGSYDNCSVSGLFMDKQLFTRFNIGVNDVLLVAKDPSGNAGTCTAKVTVLDTPPLTAALVNKAPTIAEVAEVKIINEPLSLDIPLSGITAGESVGTEQKVISVQATNDNQSLVKGLEVIYTPGSETGKLRVTIAAATSGTALVTLTVKDDGGTQNGGTDTVTKTFRITVENTGSVVNVTVFDDKGVAAITSVTDIDRAMMAKLWPNPTSGPVNIDLTWNDIRRVEVSVYNVLGVEVFRNQYNTGELIRFDLGEKASGIYMVKIQGEGRMVVKKVTVDRR